MYRALGNLFYFTSAEYSSVYYYSYEILSFATSGYFLMLRKTKENQLQEVCFFLDLLILCAYAAMEVF